MKNGSNLDVVFQTKRSTGSGKRSTGSGKRSTGSLTKWSFEQIERRSVAQKGRTANAKETVDRLSRIKGNKKKRKINYNDLREI